MTPFYPLLVMVLAVYRLTRLITKDTFPPVLWLRDRLVGGWRPMTDKERAAYLAYKEARGPLFVKGKPTTVELPLAPKWMKSTQSIDFEEPLGTQEARWVERSSWVPYWLSELISCPWCVSGWVSLALVAATAATTGVPAPLLVWPAVWAGGAVLASRSWL